ncbi:MAG TPA: hypothetical protein VGG02_09530 [Chthoniobacterales bacterium]
MNRAAHLPGPRTGLRLWQINQTKREINQTKCGINQTKREINQTKCEINQTKREVNQTKCETLAGAFAWIDQYGGWHYY